MARLFAQGQPVINGAAADGESLVRLHFAQAAIKGRQNSQTQIHTIRFAHFNSVAQKTLRAIYTIYRCLKSLIFVTDDVNNYFCTTGLNELKFQKKNLSVTNEQAKVL